MLTVSNLSIHFANRYLFDEVTFTIGDNDRIGLIGRNGTGKSTLLKIIAGEQIAEEGRIIKSNEYRIGYLPQDGNLESELSVFAEAKKALDEIIELEKTRMFGHTIKGILDMTTNELENKIVKEVGDEK